MKLSKYTESLKHALDQTEATLDAGKAVALDDGLTQAVEMILAVGSTRKIMVLGNGGSAAIAAHFQTDLCHTLGLRAIEFTAPSLLTALANDNGYETAFPSLAARWTDSGDLLIAISSSGRSRNILEAVGEVRARQGKIITLSGFAADNPLRAMGDLNFHVPAATFGLVETAHAALAHYLADQAALLKSR
jgi:D-sedoheptulose 7-phosphate isomerase